MTYRQAEEIAGLSRTTLRKLVDEGAIKVRRVGRAVRINRASLDAYMNGDATTPGKTSSPPMTEDGKRGPDPIETIPPGGAGVERR